MQPSLKRLASLLAFVSCGLAPTVARADNPVALALDVGKVIESSYAWLEGRGSKQLVVSPRVADKPAATATFTVNGTEKPATTPPLRLSLVARDWEGAYTVTGGTMVTDELRLSRSSRMAVARARLDMGSFQPYVHAAMGEWRYDPAILPLLPANKEYASQLAVGFQYRVAKHARLAVEADYTLLCRESREPQNNPSPSVFGSYAVFRTGF